MEPPASTRAEATSTVNVVVKSHEAPDSTNSTTSRASASIVPEHSDVKAKESAKHEIARSSTQLIVDPFGDDAMHIDENVSHIASYCLPDLT